MKIRGYHSRGGHNMRKPKVENKYNLKPSDINKLIVKDRSKIKEPLFWRNNVINAWCILKSIGTDADRRFCDDNEVWIGIYDKPYYRHEVHYHCTCWGGMGDITSRSFSIIVRLRQRRIWKPRKHFCSM